MLRRSSLQPPPAGTLARACSVIEPRTSGTGAAHQPWIPSPCLPLSRQAHDNTYLSYSNPNPGPNPNQAHDNTYLSYSRNAIISTYATEGSNPRLAADPE